MKEVFVNGYVIDDTVSFVWDSNPKRRHAKVWHRYENYSQACSLAEYVELSQEFDGHTNNVRPSLRYDEANGYLTLVDSDGNIINDKSED